MSDVANRRVLLVGWDGADWKVINSLVDQGKMQNIERLMNRGVMGNMATLEPALSPMLWTSIATGKRPFKHGILGFVEPKPDGQGVRPVSILSRTTRSLWNIFTLQGMKSNIVGWWPSHPAEPINGVMVSNHYHRSSGFIDKPWPIRPGTVHPQRLVKNLADLRLHPQDLSAEQLLAFVPRAAEIDQEKDRRLHNLAKTIAECTTIQSAATALIQLEPWDFMGVYFDSIDHFSHGFMRYHPPRMEGISEDDFEMYKGVVEAGYRLQDAMLGVLMGLAGDDTTIMLVSDHGFHPDDLRPSHIPSEPAGPAVQHRTHGIFLLAGPGIKQDERIYGASILDVTPTILSLYGLPMGEDMDGKALTNVFKKPPVIDSISSWDDVEGEDGQHPPETGYDPIEATEEIKQLAALGYIEEPDEDKGRAVAETEAELRYNLARSYMHAHRPLDALTYLQSLREDFPDDQRYGIQLMRCLNTLSRTKEAREVMEETLARRSKSAGKAREAIAEWHEKHGEDSMAELSEKDRRELRKLKAKATTSPFSKAMLHAAQCRAEKEHEKAFEWLQKARELKPENPDLILRIAENRLAVKKWQEGEDNFRNVLEVDPERDGAYLGLARSLMPQRRNYEAADAILSAIGLHYYNPPAHYLLGVVLHRLGRIPAAVEALMICLAQNPNYAEAHKRLAYIYRKRMKNEERAKEHEKEEKEARERVRLIQDGKTAPTGVNTGRTPTTSYQSTPHLNSDPLEGSLGNTVIIVSGLPRSGTSMMMRMLSYGGLPILTDGKREADEGNRYGYFEYEPVKHIAKNSTWIADAQGKAVKIVSHLLMHLPRNRGYSYRVVMMERDIEETVASQRKLIVNQNRRAPNMPDSLRAKSLSQRAEYAKRQLALNNIPTLVVKYAECIETPSVAASRVNAFLGGELDAFSMADAVDPSLSSSAQGTRGD